jgi:hypothetical protein
MNPRGRDNAADRKVGQHWEFQFCMMAREHDKVFTPHQFGRPDQSAMFYGGTSSAKSQFTLPDITIWSAPGEHHEIKHKNRDQLGCYGLEVYRLDALVRFANATGQRVYYTIHDWELAGAARSGDVVGNDIQHWFAGDVIDLSRGCTRQAKGWTYYNGGQRQVDIWYWSFDPARSRVRWFRPLAEVWDLAPAAA